MEKLPFELSKYHKTDTKRSWKHKGLITDEFEEIYERYIYSSHCELCKKKYKSRRDRHMDHSHKTGKFRNVCCRSCNMRRRDVKISTNTSGYTHIHEHKNPVCKQGFDWQFKVRINGKTKTLKTAVDLEKVIQFRDKWYKDNPDYFT